MGTANQSSISSTSIISSPVQVHPCSHEQLYYATMWSLPRPPILLDCSRSPCIRLTCSRAHSCRATPSFLCAVWSGRGLCKQSRRILGRDSHSWLRLQLAPTATVAEGASAFILERNRTRGCVLVDPKPTSHSNCW